MFKYNNKYTCTLKFVNKNEEHFKNIIKQRKFLRFQSTITAAPLNNKELTEASAKQEWQNAKPYEEIPSLSAFTLLKNFLPGGKYAKLDISELMLALKKDLGNISKLPGMFGRPDSVFTHNVEDFATVFRNEGTWPMRPGLAALNYHRSVHRADFFQGTEGVLATDGEQWGKFRSAVNPVLLQPKNAILYLHKMSQVNKEFIERIREIRDPNTLEVPDTFEEEINRWTFESVCIVALDKQLGLLNKNRNNPRAKEMFETLNDFIAISFEIETKPSIWRYYKTPAFKKEMKCLDTILEITNSYVSEAFERLENERRNGVSEKPESEKSVLEKLTTIDKKIATVMAMEMLMAGVDTTSSTFTGILLSLAKNPEKQQKLRKEVMRILPQKDSEFDKNSVKNMPYLRACIKESLRTFPLTVGNARVVANDIVISGYRIPKGTQVNMIATALLSDDTHYPRSKEFLPERWLRSNGETDTTTECPHSLKASSPFIYLPFGYGPRGCIGRRIAEMELELGIARLIRNFHIEFNYPTDKAFKSLMISVPNIPLKFKFSDVEN